MPIPSNNGIKPKNVTPNSGMKTSPPKSELITVTGSARRYPVKTYFFCFLFCAVLCMRIKSIADMKPRGKNALLAKIMSSGILWNLMRKMESCSIGQLSVIMRIFGTFFVISLVYELIVYAARSCPVFFRRKYLRSARGIPGCSAGHR